MALFKTRGAAIYGIDAHLIDVDVDMFASGNARDSVMVGMPDVAVRESRERIKSALINSGFGYPNKRITINLAPANVRKEGAGFDLPVAMGILGAMGAVKALDNHIFIGELSLDGAIRPVRVARAVWEGLPPTRVERLGIRRTHRGGRRSPLRIPRRDGCSPSRYALARPPR